MEKILMLSVVIEAFKKSVMFLCTPFANRRLFGIQRMGFMSPCIAHQTSRDFPCADSPDRDSGFTRSPQCP